MSRVEFARKLGYAEPLVHIALARLDTNPSQNELLEELIKLDHNANANNYNTKNKCSLDPQCEQPIFSEMPWKSTITNSTFEIGSNFALRPIVIDGSNVAISHGNKEVFSCRGIMLCVDWFKKRGHNDITVFVPKWRKENFSFDNPIKDQEILNELERERMLVFTPSRLISGKRMVCYDDRYILKLAVENDGVVVSNDNYRDLMQESSEFKKVIEERILMFSFVNDRFMPPDDPLGRLGPTLDNFLRIYPKKINISLPCPYGKKCTYGNKCKFHHPERDFGLPKSIAQRIVGNAAFQTFPCNSGTQSIHFPKLARKSMSVPLNGSLELSRDEKSNLSKKPLCRTKSEVEENSSSYLPLSFEHSYNTMSRKNLSQCTPVYNVMKHESPHENVQIVVNDKHEEYVNGSFDKQKEHLKIPETTAECSAEPQSIHRKLRRQLTLNVIGETYTSRKLNVHKIHRPLASSYSEPRSQHSVLSNLHQNITRVNSAPDAYRKIGPYSPPSSELLDLHLNENQLENPTAEDKRRKLYYHLSNIFPANQVQAIMQIHPNETNPQRICAAILSMYPNI